MTISLVNFNNLNRFSATQGPCLAISETSTVCFFAGLKKFHEQTDKMTVQQTEVDGPKLF